MKNTDRVYMKNVYSTKSQNTLKIEIGTLTLWEIILFHGFISIHLKENSFQLICKNNGSTENNTDSIYYEEFLSTKKQNAFRMVAKHIKTMGNHSLSAIHMDLHTKKVSK